MRTFANVIITIISSILIVVEIVLLILCWIVVPKLVKDSNISSLLNNIANPITDIREGLDAIEVDEFDTTALKDGDVAEVFGYNMQVSGNITSKYVDKTSNDTTVIYLPEGNSTDNILFATLDTKHNITDLIWPYLKLEDTETDTNLVSTVASVLSDYIDPGVVKKYYYLYHETPIPLFQYPETQHWYSVLPQETGCLVISSADPVCLTDQWETIKYRSMADIDKNEIRDYSLYEMEAIYNKQRQIQEDSDGTLSMNMAGIQVKNDMTVNEENGTAFNDEKHKETRLTVLNTLKTNTPTQDGHVGDLDFRISTTEGQKNMFTIDEADSTDGKTLVTPDSLTISGIKFSNLHFTTHKDNLGNITEFNMNEMTLTNMSQAQHPYIIVFNLISDNNTLIAQQYIDGTANGLKSEEVKPISFEIPKILYPGKLKGIQIAVV